MTAPGGRVELGALAQGKVEFNQFDGSLNYEGVESFGDILLERQALVDASGVGGSAIQVQGRSLELRDGSLIGSDKYVVIEHSIPLLILTFLRNDITALYLSQIDSNDKIFSCIAHQKNALMLLVKSEYRLMNTSSSLGSRPNCPYCNCERTVKNGSTHNKKQKYVKNRQ